jgi:hypothetical protein
MAKKKEEQQERGLEGIIPKKIRDYDLERREGTRKQTSLTLAEERIDLVLERLLKGVQHWEIIREFTAKYGIGEVSVWKYITTARGYLKQWREQSRDQLIDETFARYMQLYQVAIESKNFSEARSILKDYSKLLGLEAPVKVDMQKTLVNISIQLDDDKNSPLTF